MPSNPIPSLPSSTPSWAGSGMGSSPYSTAAAAGGGGASQRESSFHRKRPTLGISEGKRRRFENTSFSKIKNTKIAFVVSNWPWMIHLPESEKITWFKWELESSFFILKTTLFFFFWCGTFHPFRYLRGGWHHLVVKTRQTNNQGRAVVR